MSERRRERRQRARDAAKGVRDRERLARLSPGGAPERPIVVPSASVVETHARAATCPLCEGPLRVDEHTAETVSGVALRAAHVTCTRCGAARQIWFRLQPPAPN